MDLLGPPPHLNKLRPIESAQFLSGLTASILSGRSQPSKRGSLAACLFFMYVSPLGLVEVTPTSGGELISALVKRSVRGVNPEFVASSARMALLGWGLNCSKSTSITLINSVLCSHQGADRAEVVLFLIIILLLKNSHHVSRLWPRSKAIVIACVNAASAANKDLRQLGLMGVDLVNKIGNTSTNRTEKRNITEIRQNLGSLAVTSNGSFSLEKLAAEFDRIIM